jgi:hypothetical protein
MTHLAIFLAPQCPENRHPNIDRLNSDRWAFIWSKNPCRYPVSIVTRSREELEIAGARLEQPVAITIPLEHRQRAPSHRGSLELVEFRKSDAAQVMLGHGSSPPEDTKLSHYRKYGSACLGVSSLVCST